MNQNSIDKTEFVTHNYPTCWQFFREERLMKNTSWFSLLVAAVVFAVSLDARADTIITFDSVPSVGNPIRTTPLTTDGFTFTSLHYHIIDTPSDCSGGCVSDGTNYIAVDGPTLGFPLVMTAAGGGTFSLISLDAAKLWLTIGGLPGFPNAITFDVTGSLTGGGTVSASLTLPSEGSFGNVVLPATFTNLTSVTFSGTAPGTSDASWAADNIRVAAPVLEPSILLLFTTGVLGLSVLLRRKHK
jgi:hypothetical protein